MGIRNGSFLLFLIGCLFCLNPLTLPAESSEILLEANFNQGTPDAISPKGEIKAASPEKGEFVYEEGIFSQAILLSGNSLSFPAEGNIDPNQGSISFWIKPLDWGNQAEPFIPIWAIDKKEGTSWSLIFYYAKNKNSSYGQVSFRSMFQGKQFIIQQELKPDQLVSNQWSHIVLTWDTMELKVYINGEEVGSVSYGLPVVKDKFISADRIWFMPVSFWHAEHLHKTLIDEVQIFSKALNKDEVLQIYKKFKSSLVENIKKSILPVPKATKKVVIDGKLGKGEWEDATKVPLMKQHINHYLVSLPAWAFIKYDDKFLYIGYEVFYQEELRLTGKAKERDKEVFNGDEVEFDCRLPGDSEDHYYQFSVGPNGSYAYLRSDAYNKINWDWLTNFLCGADVERDRWTCEMAIPLYGIGYSPDINTPLEANIGLHRPNEESLGGGFERWLCWSSGGKRFVDRQSMGLLKFMPDSTHIQIDQIGDIIYGRLNLRIQGDKIKSIIKVISEDKQKIIEKELLLERGKEVSFNKELETKGEGLFSIEGFSGDNDLIFNYSCLFYIKDPFDFSFVCDANKQELEIKVNITGLKDRYLSEIKEGKVKIIASLESEDGKTYGQNEIAPEVFESAFRLPFQELPVGKYTVKVVVLAGDEKLEKEQILERPSPIFLQDRKGIERYVPAPWKAIEKQGDTVITAFHKYAFGQGPFPTKAWSQGEVVLEQEPTLKVKVGGTTHTLTPISSKDIEISPDRIISEGRCEAKEANLCINWKRRIDYDGLIRCDIILSPITNSVKVDSFILETVVPISAARYALTPTYNHTWTTNSNATINTFPMAWLTNDKVGLCLFTDTDANWVYPKRTQPIKLIKEREVGIIQANIITSSVMVNGSVPYVFGLMGTPGKPPRDDWRKIHAEGWGRKGQTLQTRGWPHEKELWWENQFLLTRLLYPEKAKASIDRYKEKGIDCIPYACGGWMPDNNPIYDYYGYVWEPTVEGRPYPKFYKTTYEGKSWYFASVCANSGYADYLTYYTDKFMKENIGFKGLYLDAGGPIQCDSPRHGCLREDVFNKNRIPLSYNIFALRSMYERLYKIIHQYEPKGYLYTHSWETFYPPVVSFVDIVNPGEEFMHTAPGHPETYIDDVPLEKWQSNYSSQVIGCVVQFLGESVPTAGTLVWKGSEEERMPFTRPLLTCCLLHDIPLSGSQYLAVEKAWEILDRNNVSSAEFAPYWRQKEITTGEEKVLVSYYYWEKEKRYLVMIGNWNPEEKLVTLQFNNNLAKNTIRSVDEETGQEIDLKGPISIDGRGFRIISIQCK